MDEHENRKTNITSSDDGTKIFSKRRNNLSLWYELYMDLNKTYANWQSVSSLTWDILTYFFKTWIMKAQWEYKNDLMEGEWIFNRESGKLWQVGNFVHGEKHGLWIRYNAEGRIEYKAEFANNKLVKKN